MANHGNANCLLSHTVRIDNVKHPVSWKVNKCCDKAQEIKIELMVR